MKQECQIQADRLRPSIFLFRPPLPVPCSLKDSTTLLVNSSTNSGTPSVLARSGRSLQLSVLLPPPFQSSPLPVLSQTIEHQLEICEWLPRRVNSGRNVRTRRSLVVGICSMRRRETLTTTDRPSADPPTRRRSLAAPLALQATAPARTASALLLLRCRFNDGYWDGVGRDNNAVNSGIVSCMLYKAKARSNFSIFSLFAS